MLEYQGISRNIREYQGLYGFQNILSAEMFQQVGRVSGYEQRQKVNEEFLAIFYRELLKQAFKPPKLGLGSENNSLTGAFSSDLLVERLALELARNRAFSADTLFPSGLGEYKW